MTRIVLVVSSLVLFGGCGAAGGTGGPDGGDAAAPDAAPDGPSACAPEFGRAYVTDLVEFPPEDQGRDLDGDGTIDNAMGVLAAFANPGFAEAVRNGENIYLWDHLRWTDPPTPTDADVGLVFYRAMDADDPPDPTNNFSGTGEFLIPTNQLDVNCQPISMWQQTTITDRVLRSSTDIWSFVVAGVGTVELIDVEIVSTFSADYSRFDGQLTGIFTACALSRAPIPGSTSGMLLDAMAVYFGRNPDIDLDGDGLETVVTDGTRVTSCIDGDGTTEILGSDCACDPRIADGYSGAIHATGITARILGVGP